MKTETLIELQRSITQGEWRALRNAVIDHDQVWAGQTRIATLTERAESESNQQAIALVPELIAEVIRLRIALGLIVNECSEQQVTENAIVTSRPSLLCLEQCRAALANDK